MTKRNAAKVLGFLLVPTLLLWPLLSPETFWERLATVIAGFGVGTYLVYLWSRW